MKTLRDPKPARSERRTAIKLDSTIGEEAWRKAAGAYVETQRYFQQLGDNASERVVPLCRFRKGSAEALEQHARWAARAREAAVKVIFAPAPTPRELANKIKLLALIQGLPDPASSYQSVSPPAIAAAVEAGWLPLEDMLGQLWADAQLLEQFHDAETFVKAGKRRRKAAK